MWLLNFFSDSVHAHVCKDFDHKKIRGQYKIHDSISTLNYKRSFVVRPVLRKYLFQATNNNLIIDIVSVKMTDFSYQKNVSDVQFGKTENAKFWLAIKFPIGI